MLPMSTAQMERGFSAVKREVGLEGQPGQQNAELLCVLEGPDFDDIIAA